MSALQSTAGWFLRYSFAPHGTRSLASDSDMALDYDAFFHARMERYAYCKSSMHTLSAAVDANASDGVGVLGIRVPYVLPYPFDFLLICRLDSTTVQQ